MEKKMENETDMQGIIGVIVLTPSIPLNVTSSSPLPNPT